MSGLLNLIPIFLIFLVIYLLLVLPQMQEQKRLKKLIENLKEGDKVVTQGGIHGVVKKVEKNTVTLKIAPKAEVVFEKTAIVRVIGKKS